MSLRSEILDLLSTSPGLTDREITNRLRGTDALQQPINIACRELENSGLLKRERNRLSDGFIGNYPTGAIETFGTKEKNTKPTEEPLQEDAIKSVLEIYLRENGWTTEIAFGKAPGADIIATRQSERWIIEVKGPGSRDAMRVNYFLAILGETLQRMDDPNTRYSIALPDLKQYRGLWSRLPRLAKNRTNISCLFISPNGEISDS